METNNYKHYLAPEFEVITIDVEQGFALSNLENPVEKPEMNWQGIIQTDMKRLLTLLVLVLCSCTETFVGKEIARPNNEILPDLTAVFADKEATRTYVENGKYLRWHEDDRITAFYGNTLNRQYKFNGTTGDNSGTFSLVPSGELGTGNAFDRIYALYPYSTDARITDEGLISLTLPATQTYAENSFGLGANTMVAVTENLEDTFLAFKNACGYLKLKLYNAEGATLKSIEVKGNNGEPLAGDATLSINFGETPVLTLAESATDTIRLDCGDGVALGTTTETATELWIVLPATTFANGLTITATDTEGGLFEKSTTNEVVIERNTIQPMAALETEFVATKPANNEIWYNASQKIKLGEYSSIYTSFEASVLSHTFNDETKRGIIEFDRDLKIIGEDAFMYSNINAIYLPSTITTIGYCAFYGCLSLNTIYFPKSLTYISQYAFFNCQNLQHIYIEDIASWCNIEMWGEDSCPSYYYAYLYLNGTKVSTLLIPNTTKKIEAYSFRGVGVDKIIISDGVETIGLTAFKGCSPKTVYIPQSITDLGPQSFELCSGELTIDCECINHYTPTGSSFYRNYFTKIVIGDSVTTIEDYIFNECDKLKHIVIGHSVTNIEDFAFYDTPCLEKIEGPFSSSDNRCLIVDNKLVAFAPANLTEYSIPEGVTTLRENIMYNYNNLKSITIPSTTTSIEKNAIGMSVEKLYSKAIVPPTIENSLWTKEIYVPYESVEAYRLADKWGACAESIFAYDFSTNTVVKEKPDDNEIWYTTSDEQLLNIDGDVFNTSITSHDYSNGKGVITFNKAVTNIGEYAFYNQSTLTSITLPNCITEIGQRAFSGCNLTSFTFPTSLRRIGYCALSSSIETIICNTDEAFTIGDDQDNNYYSYIDLGVSSKTLSRIEGKYATSDNRFLVVGNTLCAFAARDISTCSLTISDKNICSYVFWNCDFNSLVLNNCWVNAGAIHGKIETLSISDGVIKGKGISGTINYLEIDDKSDIDYEGFNISCKHMYINTEYIQGDYSDDYWPPFHYSSFGTITFGTNVKNIGDAAFNSVRNVYCKPTTPPYLGDYVFSCTECIYVPYTTVNKYKSSSGWSSYASKIIGYDFVKGEIVGNENGDNQNGRYTVTLNNAWRQSTSVSNPDSSLYDGVYESYSNYNVNDGVATMYIDIEGYTEFSIYVRSNAESTYDYVTVSEFDSTTQKMSTSGNQNSGTAISNYTKVTYTDIDGGSHRITVTYKKDFSQHSGTDRGYLIIPKNQ